MATTVAAVFDDLWDAQQALHDLVGHGFARRDISLITNDSSGKYAQYVNGGAVVGAIAGLLIGLGVIVIPGIGAALAAGPLFGLIGAGLGAVAGGLLGALVELGVPQDSAGYYAEAIRRGGTLVLVATNDRLLDRVSQLINRHGPVDLIRRVERWKGAGWSRFDPTALPYNPAEVAHERELARTYNDRINSAGVG